MDWVEGCRFPRPTVVHLDADLYSSTLFILIHVLPRLKKGDILIFDQFGDCLHEFKAFIDATTAYPSRFQALCRTSDGLRIALKMFERSAARAQGGRRGAERGNMKIQLTGGAGHVGGACLRWLLERGHAPVAQDNLSEEKPASIPGASDRLIVGAIEDGAAPAAVLRDIGTGKGDTVLEVLRACEEAVGRPIPHEFSGRRSGDRPVLIGSADRLQSDLGWSPRYRDIRDFVRTAWERHSRHPRGYAGRAADGDGGRA